MSARELAQRYLLVNVDPDVLYVDNGQILVVRERRRSRPCPSGAP